MLSQLALVPVAIPRSRLQPRRLRLERAPRLERLAPVLVGDADLVARILGVGVLVRDHLVAHGALHNLLLAVQAVELDPPVERADRVGERPPERRLVLGGVGRVVDQREQQAVLKFDDSLEFTLPLLSMETYNTFADCTLLPPSRMSMTNLAVVTSQLSDRTIKSTQNISETTVARVFAD